MRRKVRKLRFLPLALLVGVEGFALVVPYLLCFLALVLIVRNLQARTAVPAA